ncbi:hypothetical protein H4R18_003355 [Coemansia javaensis]|uniref:Major facilitator superfamily (MFS) profile domain-containing protein n=1 Tax=Coemansia javaensis TaxID=2761396 RepID=A0A9W8H909_9FUNG|nr:hypothetical protein H4R18_003355 [Coemansia javaensis]
MAADAAPARADPLPDVTSAMDAQGSADNTTNHSDAQVFAEKEIVEAGAEEAQAEDAGSAQGFEREQMPRRRLHFIIAGLCLLYFIAALDMTILATVYVDISGDYNSLQSGIWIITSYLLANTAVQPLFGKFSDILGRFEAVAGIGGGGLLSMPSVILSDIVSERERGKYTSFLAGSWGVASAIGPVVGGAIVEHSNWRIIFWINLPVCVPTAILLFFVLRLPRPSGSAREKLRRIDFLGAAVFQAFIIPIIIAFAWGGQGHSWVSGRVLGTILGSAAVGVVFLLVEWKVSPEPIVPLRLFKVRNVAVSSAAHFMLGACIYAPLMFIPLWEMSVKRSTEIGAGLRTLPLMVGMVVTATISGAVTTRLGRYRVLIVLCGVLVALGNSLLLLYKPTTSSWQRIVTLAIPGLGLGFGIQTLIIAAQCAVGGLDMAATTTLVLFMRTLGGIFSLSILSSVFNTRLRSASSVLSAQFPAYAGIISTSLNDESVIRESVASLPPELVRGLADMFHDAMHRVFIGLIPFSALMVVCTLLFGHTDLNRLRKKTIK